MSIMLALIGLAGLVGGGTILFVLARQRANVAGAFALGLVAMVAVVVLLGPSIDAVFDGATDTGLVTGMAVMLAAGLVVGGIAMRVVFPKPAARGPKVQERADQLARRQNDQGARRDAKPPPRKPAGPPPDVFISYKRDERAEVLAIARRLEALKLRVWFDAEMKSGTTFDAEIDRQVRAAKAVLVCWSPGAVASDWVRGEATIGRQRGVLAAAMLKPCDLPAPFNLVHADNLTGGIDPRNPEWLRAVDRIGMLAGRPGLAAYEALELTKDKNAYAAWIAQNSGDALLNNAVERLKQL